MLRTFMLFLFLSFTVYAQADEFQLNFHLVCEQDTSSCKQLYLNDTTFLPITQKPSLTLEDIQKAEIAPDQYIQLTFTELGTKKLHDLSTLFYGYRVAVLINDQPIMIPRFIAPQETGSLTIGRFNNTEQLKSIIDNINQSVKNNDASPELNQ